MNEALAEPLTGFQVMAVAVTVAGVVAGLVRACVAYRARIQQERELTTRTTARVTWLVRLAEADHEVVRIVERDRDGHREVELGGRGVPSSGAAGEAA
ncbi:hypothetical protein ACGFI4_20975 [Micromonospora carbonacea]|uniref:Uncharacterized protein n=1 Tax=Micromonospora carbonacea TaxID=47853 RepID=A0A7H8XHX5_9ACTN|nr:MULTISPECIES: hypothetical protein [Micromonospora]MBB5829367.1 hypothetical protein [Micromonospora carbonacea]MDG4816700.1 hypothetical protein [Micromonospora sp. WMMD956]QLD23191.1 hypothetical protein HXZ27_02195 [Micromonospora carbonacea]WFE59181.1 hypothetical protein O7633_21090 [Micromonospora sp. WMMD712]